MHGLTCDRCDKSLLVDEDARYIVEVKVYAAYDVLEASREDLERSSDPEVWRRLLAACEERSADELQDEVYREMRFDLCVACQKAYLRDPIPGRTAPPPPPRSPDAEG